MPNPTDPAQRSETRTEWRNVYRVLNRVGEWVEARVGGFESLEQTHFAPRYKPSVIDGISYPRVAIEEVTTTITRHPIPETEAGR